MSKNTWTIDPMHSEIQFKVKHLMISTVTGGFTKIYGAFHHESEDFTDAEIDFSADITSIYTGNEQRDNHLKSGDFFDAAQYPQLTFKSTGVEKVSENKYKVHGHLTMKGVTKPVDMDAEFGGSEKDGYGNTKAGFDLSGVISRKEFGLTYNQATETGGVVLSDDVKVMGSLQFTKS